MQYDNPNETRTNASDLVSAKYACKEIGRTRATFYRMLKRQLVPPPVIREPIQLWSKRQLRLSTMAEVQRDSKTGIWIERNPETLKFAPLPNQYFSQLPTDTA